jgi:hypothetical protein
MKEIGQMREYQEKRPAGEGLKPAGDGAMKMRGIGQIEEC